MAVAERYRQDVAEILSHRHDLGADLWTTEDRRLLKGAPFSALESPLHLVELGVEPDDPVLTAVAEMFLDVWREDGWCRNWPGWRSAARASRASRRPGGTGRSWRTSGGGSGGRQIAWEAVTA